MLRYEILHDAALIITPLKYAWYHIKYTKETKQEKTSKPLDDGAY
jgi:hypothetical protein